MAKNPVKKTAAKKAGRQAAKKTVAIKKTALKKVPAKKTLTDKERDQRAANLIANSEKKGKVTTRKKKPVSRVKTSDVLQTVVDGMREKKAKNIMVMDLRKLENRVTDYYVICDADSNTHVNSIADSVEEIVEKRAGERAYHAEGHQNGEWILLDYINVVAHVFLREAREHYNIEALWGDAEITLIND